MIGACRRLGVPARYVSGYVHQAGEIATHAWCQVWAGPAGWVEVDPTLGVFAGEQHVLTAVGRDYSDVPPNRGVWKGTAEETIAVAVTVEPLDRLPPDWADLTGRGPWPGGGQGQTQRGDGGRKKPQLGSHRTLYRHQQSQQQQATSLRV
jgi:transglutaminase-like putative cysteine protease